MIEETDYVEVEGAISAVLSHGVYKVKFPNKHEVNARISGKMRKFKIKIVTGDWVSVKISKYDLKNGLIMFRHRNRPRGENFEVDISA